MDEEQIMSVMEQLISDVFKKHLDVDLGVFPRMAHSEAMHRFGSDKPDLRIDLELVDIADLMKEVEFKVFSGPANDAQSRVAALRVPQWREHQPQGDRRLYEVCWHLRRQGFGLG